MIVDIPRDESSAASMRAHYAYMRRRLQVATRRYSIPLATRLQYPEITELVLQRVDATFCQRFPHEDPT